MEEAQTKNQTRKTQCTVCGKWLRHLGQHLKIHTGQRDYKCDYQGCEKAFYKKEDLIRHIRVHTDERPYKCAFRNCTKSFKQKSELIDHSNVHTGMLPYECDVCGKQFAYQPVLRGHTKVHDTAKYDCELCGIKLKSRSSLVCHRQSQKHLSKQNALDS